MAQPMVLYRPNRATSSFAKPGGEEIVKPGGRCSGSNWIGDR